MAQLLHHPLLLGLLCLLRLLSLLRLLRLVLALQGLEQLVGRGLLRFLLLLLLPLEVLQELLLGDRVSLASCWVGGGCGSEE